MTANPTVGMWRYHDGTIGSIQRWADEARDALADELVATSLTPITNTLRKIVHLPITVHTGCTCPQCSLGTVGYKVEVR